MQWHRIRQAASKHAIKTAEIDLPTVIKARMNHEARMNGAVPDRDRFVFMQRADDWLVEFTLEVNAPDYALTVMRNRGWEPMP